MLGHLACTFPRESRVVAIDILEHGRQRLGVRMTNQMQANVDTIPHALQYFVE